MIGDASRRVSQLSDVAQALASAPDQDARLELAVQAAVVVVDHCDHAAIMINEKRGPVVRASSDDVAQRADLMQCQSGEGPSLDVMRTRETLVVPALEHEQRWSKWAQRARDELDMGSMLSLLIYTDRTTHGALSLYARRGERFDADDVATGQALATHISVIVTAQQQIDQLGLAMHNRSSIGQAQGILMERLWIDPEEALNYLKRASSHMNRKLADVAAELADTRRMPDLKNPKQTRCRAAHTY